MQKALAKFKSKPQLLRFLAIEYSKRFHEGKEPQEFYKEFKEKKGFSNAKYLADDIIERYITSFEFSLDYGRK